MKFAVLAAVTAFLLPSFVASQLSGAVGPLTTRASKQKKICNVLNYGGVASKTSDIGPAIESAFNACKTGGTVYIPPGDYGMSTWVDLSGGNAWAIQLDGIIYRTGTASGNMFMIKHTTDFEMYSSTSKGAIQGYGYQYHTKNTYGARILRLWDAKSFSVHDLALVDSPAFHLVMDTCVDGEIYNIVVHGGNRGGLDGIDVWGTNIHIHDVEVSNKDECVCVKNPSKNLLIENVYCNWSGGSAIGSLGADTDITNIVYRNVYTHHSNQMLMIKSNGGSGSVSNSTFSNFIGHSNAYSLNINAYWTQASLAAGPGVLYEKLSFRNWTGTAANAVQRAPMNIVCPDGAPCTDLSFNNFSIWTDTGSSALQKCQNAWGTGGCLKNGSQHTSYAMVTSTIKSVPTEYAAAKMPNDLKAGLGLTVSIAIPTIPSSYFPGATPAIAKLGK